MKIALIGYMGSGKSFLGQRLAHALHVPFLDLDAVLEQKYLSRSISEFINDRGELAFRKIEQKALKETLQHDGPFVLATGGGTPCYYDNVHQLNTLATTIYLNASVRTISGRLTADRAQRPMISHLGDQDVLEFVAKHIFERRPFYTQARYTLNEEHCTLEHIQKLLSTHDIRSSHSA